MFRIPSGMTLCAGANATFCVASAALLRQWYSPGYFPSARDRFVPRPPAIPTFPVKPEPAWDAEEQITVAIPRGIHMVPSSRLTKIAQGYAADRATELWIQKEGQPAVTMTSIFAVMMLGVPEGASVRVMARGEAAAESLAEVRRVLSLRGDEEEVRRSLLMRLKGPLSDAVFERILEIGRDAFVKRQTSLKIQVEDSAKRERLVLEMGCSWWWLCGAKGAMRIVTQGPAAAETLSAVQELLARHGAREIEEQNGLGPLRPLLPVALIPAPPAKISFPPAPYPLEHDHLTFLSLQDPAFLRKLFPIGSHRTCGFDPLSGIIIHYGGDHDGLELVFRKHAGGGERSDTGGLGYLPATLVVREAPSREALLDLIISVYSPAGGPADELLQRPGTPLYELAFGYLSPFVSCVQVEREGTFMTLLRLTFRAGPAAAGERPRIIRKP